MTEPSMPAPSSHGPLAQQAGEHKGGASNVLPPISSQVKLVIPGRPAAWQRARSNGKVRFDSPEQARNKLTIGQIGAMAMQGRPPLEGPLEVTVRAYWPWPKSMSEKKRRAYGSQFFTNRPDSDNIAKLLGDALNGIVWRDDAQIVSLHVSKAYAVTPMTFVLVTPLMNQVKE